MFRYLLILGLFALLEASPLQSIVRSLPAYQSENGGFRNSPNEEVSANATADALFLASLFGFRNQVNSFEANRFIGLLQNSDGGYGVAPGHPSDILSVRNALFAQQQLGSPSTGPTATYIKSLRTPDGTFGSQVGARGDLSSTLSALQSLQFLGEDQYIQEIAADIKAYLAEHETETFFSYPEEEVDPVTCNYYALLLADIVGMEVTDPDQKADWARNHFGSSYASVASLSAAISSLHILEPAFLRRFPGIAVFQSKVQDVHDAALAFEAIARTGDFQNSFELGIHYDVLDSTPVQDHIIQGIQLKPMFSIKSFIGIPHSSLEVEVDIKFGDDEPLNSALQWDAKSGTYVSYNFYDSSEKLGRITFGYSIRYFVVGFGEIAFRTTDVKQIGYGINTKASALQPMLQKQIREGDEVSLGTEFNFVVTMRNQTEPLIESGPFDVIFDVLDSSDVVLFSKTIDGSSGKPFEFDYTLEQVNIPSGVLAFRFNVQDKELGVVHSSRRVIYLLNFPMVATQITFLDDQTDHQIGGEAVVTMIPAAYPDFRNVLAFPRNDFNGVDASPNRRFFMDILDASGTPALSVPGRPVANDNGLLELEFTVDIKPSLDSIGNNDLSFRYATEVGEVTLLNYDSATGETYDETTPVSFNVDARLQMTDVVDKPAGDGDFFYGNEISFRFKLKDAVSGEFITAPDSAHSNVYLELRHASESGKPFVSVKEPAVMENGYFVINWAINPNAVRGDGELALVAEDASQNTHVIYTKTDEPVLYQVSIGGDIDVRSKDFSTEISDKSTFLVDFALSCKGIPLMDALLKASVYLKTNGQLQPVAKVPIAMDPEGTYQTSWDQEDAPSGEYVLQFYRETDLARAQELRSAQEKQQRKDDALKGVDSKQQPRGDIEDDVDPLFEVTFHHQAAPKPILPIRTELIVLGVLLLAFLAVSSKKP